MAKTPLWTIIEGYEPFDLLRLSQEDFYAVVEEKFQGIEIQKMELYFITVEHEGEHEVLIEAEIIDYCQK